MLLRKDIEVVITALTRNQVCGNASWVRIPLFPPLVNNTNPETKTGFVLFFFVLFFFRIRRRTVQPLNKYSVANQSAAKQIFCSEPSSRQKIFFKKIQNFASKTGNTI